MAATRILCIGSLLLLLASCSQPSPVHQSKLQPESPSAIVASAMPSVDAATPADLPGIHNVVTYAEDMYSGSVPQGEQGFETLKALGVRTIISVDGAKPDVAAAKARGMRYVHLPIGYNGVDETRRLEIARAVRDLPGPIYMHCHHGKHRSAGALGAATVSLGMMTPEQAIERMKVSGIAPNYVGLYECVATATIASEAQLDAASNDFPETWQTTGLVQLMVEADEAHEHLKLIERSGWVTPPNHPDLVPVAEAGRLADLLRNLQDDHEVKAESAEFRHWLLEGSRLCEALEAGLAQQDLAKDQLSAQLRLVTASCKDCHLKYRDK